MVSCPFYIMKELVRAGIFDYDTLWGEGIWTSAEKTEDVVPKVEVKPVEETKVEESESSDTDEKPIEYTFNKHKLMDFLLREGIISIKGE